MKNKTEWKLSLYFGIALLVFAIVIGGLFSYLFLQQTVATHKKEMERRALSIADTMTKYLDNEQGGHSGFGGFLRNLNNIAGTNAWIVDENKNLVLPSNMMGKWGSEEEITYKDLPEDADAIIEAAFSGQTVFGEEFSDILKESTLTIGVPVKNSQQKVIAVVLLHSSVIGISEAAKSGIGLLFACLVFGLIMAFLLSMFLSRKFTTPLLRKEAEEVIKMDKIRKEFVANISHELKTPVTVIRGSLEALTENVIDDKEKMEQYHKQMLGEAIHLQRLVGDLLDLSRLQNAEFLIEQEEFSLDDCMSNAVRSARQMGREKQVTISYEKPETDLILIGDYGRMRQMFLILLDNAIKFSPSGETVEVSFQGDTIAIRDYGNGIAEEELPHIFERFHKIRNEENVTGTGLGLAIASQIASRHGMKLSAQNSKNKGAIFFIQIFEKTHSRHNTRLE